MTHLRLLVCAWLLACASGAWASACAIDGGLPQPAVEAGEGRTGGDGSGMGGTGHSGDGSGIGGTGTRAENNDGNGMGGTGIVGVITGFGSICVNGVEVQYDSATPVHRDGAPSNAAQLAVGQLVSVDARSDRGGLRANWIEQHTAVVGPIASIDVAHGEIVVLGQKVHVTGRQAAALRVGQFVRVSGLPGGQAIVATRIVTLAAAGNMSVAGVVRAQGGHLFLGSLELSGAPADIADKRVRVDGQLMDGAFAVSRVEVAPEIRALLKSQRLILQGVNGAAAQGTMNLGYVVLPSAGKGKGNGKGKPQTSGKPIVINVRPAANGALTIDSVAPSLPLPRANANAPAGGANKEGKRGETSERDDAGTSGNGSHAKQADTGAAAGPTNTDDSRGDGSSAAMDAGHSDTLRAPDAAAGDRESAGGGQFQKPDQVTPDKPEKVSIEKPEAVAIERPEKVEVEKPEKIQIEKPERIEVEKPEKIEIQKPERIEIQKPERVEIQKPERVEIERPEGNR